MRLLPTALVLLSLAAPPRPVHASPEEDVRATFARYKQAVQTRKGTEAVREVDQLTTRYFTKLRATALSAPDVRALAVADKLMVLRMRLELPPAMLQELDGPGLIAFAINRGWVAGDQVGMAVLGKVRVAGSRAEAKLILGGQEMPTPFVFRKEPGGWKIDLTAFNPGMNKQLLAQARKQKLSADQLVLKLLEQVTGRPVSDKVWQPMNARLP